MSVSTGSLRSHLRRMLEDLAGLADLPDDPQLNRIALRLRLLAGEPALRTDEVEGEEVLLSCDRTGLQLIKTSRVSGSLRLMPAFRLECRDGCAEALCGEQIGGEREAARAFMRVQAALTRSH